jgi:UDP-glucose 4-epimerase
VSQTGSQNVLEWAMSHRVKRVVSASSAAVYGVPQVLPITENTLPAPLSPYAESKLQMEVMHERAFEQVGLSSVCLRFFNVYGPRQDPQNPYTGVISKFIGRR